MADVIIRFMNRLSVVSYFAGRNRPVKTIALTLLIAAFGALFVVRGILDSDTTIYPLPPVSLRSTMANRYVRATGTFLSDGAVEVQSRILGVINRAMRFIPFMTNAGAEPLMVLDENLPPAGERIQTMTLVGLMQRGESRQPSLFLGVMNPPSKPQYRIAGLIAALIIGGILVEETLNWLVRSADYAIGVPQLLADLSKRSRKAKPVPFLLWFGSLGAAYGSVVLRHVPVSFRAIPAEARLVPANQRDGWSVIIHRTRTARLLTIATSHGALPAVHLEFEDERGITRNGTVAASDLSVIDSLLNVLRYVGQ